MADVDPRPVAMVSLYNRAQAQSPSRPKLYVNYRSFRHINSNYLVKVNMVLTTDHNSSVLYSMMTSSLFSTGVYV